MRVRIGRELDLRKLPDVASGKSSLDVVVLVTKFSV